ncbi:tRNA1(Val) (adenine(37)-N6)-methyltransferase [Crassaminicella thermophila]|uniref:tRNA1(Val) (Adenine(37)-N6)-methyltransferase n=1 Tax=Crassaminicella thermophila TaxID=2599308 RepID=A0A5C0SFX4_CRATE|nr:tRNA1(Val) (adenine(37)-N6)-methyltransferase [Crassaminicella thermophila]QEK13393.1 tRNA1(Val) (adenine(37)-N6)-methyltransferase [Crassaminicella thermophila]
MDEKLVKEHERVDDLQCRGLRLIQNPEGFCFGIDAVLLSNFCEIRKNWRVIDLGTGTGIIPILLAGKTNAKEILGVEIQEEVAEMASRSVKLNKLEEKVKIINEDLNKIFDHVNQNSFDAVTSNPPYMNEGAGLLNPESMKAISRHEIKCTLEDVIRISSKLLKDRGHFYMVHRPHRLVDIIYLCRQYRLEPKKIRFVHPNKNKKPNILLIQCVKFGRPELKFMDPLYVYNEDGSYTDEIHKIYGREGE